MGNAIGDLWEKLRRMLRGERPAFDRVGDGHSHPHAHLHDHAEGEEHAHFHEHPHDHRHPHDHAH